MKALTWIVIAASGLGLMFYSYDRWMQIDPERPGLMDFCALATKKSRRSSSQRRVSRPACVCCLQAR